MRHKTSNGARYLIAWISLMVLTASSLGAHYLELGPLSTPVALAIALGKVSIVASIFMHLNQEPFSIRFIALLNVTWVALLCAGIALDVAGL